MWAANSASQLKAAASETESADAEELQSSPAAPQPSRSSQESAALMQIMRLQHPRNPLIPDWFQALHNSIGLNARAIPLTFVCKWDTAPLALLGGGCKQDSNTEFGFN
jgi:hypothetical protein